MGKRFFQPSPPPEGEGPRSPLKQLGWFFGLALASGAVVIVVAYILRGLLFIG